MDRNSFANFKIDFKELGEHLGQKQEAERMLKTAQAISGLRKVSQGLYCNDSEVKFWRVEKDADGKEWIVRLEEAEVKVPGWEAQEDETCEAVTLSFKGMPIHKFKASIYNFDKKTVGHFKKFLIKRIADANFRRQILSSVPAEKLLGIRKELC